MFSTHCPDGRGGRPPSCAALALRLVLLALTIFLSACHRSPPGVPSLQKASAQQQDRIEVEQHGDISVVNVYHVKGIGGAQVNAPKSGWPPAVFVRLHGFPELESFRATSKTGKLECVLARPEGKPPRRECRLGNAKVDAIERASDYFQVKLPHAMLTADNASIEVRWVDQWR